MDETPAESLYVGMLPNLSQYVVSVSFHNPCYSVLKSLMIHYNTVTCLLTGCKKRESKFFLKTCFNFFKLIYAYKTDTCL